MTTVRAERGKKKKKGYSEDKKLGRPQKGGSSEEAPKKDVRTHPSEVIRVLTQ